MAKFGNQSQHYPQNPMSRFDHFCEIFTDSINFTKRITYFCQTDLKLAKLKFKYFWSCLVLVCFHDKS